ncbi:hypothetical protein TthHC11_09140 [Thermus thermophilus]|nr:hypothetical protein TthHC11_09140 [Thermus thermophilus]
MHVGARGRPRLSLEAQEVPGTHLVPGLHPHLLKVPRQDLPPPHVQDHVVAVALGVVAHPLHRGREGGRHGVPGLPPLPVGHVQPGVALGEDGVTPPHSLGVGLAHAHGDPRGPCGPEDPPHRGLGLGLVLEGPEVRLIAHALRQRLRLEGLQPPFQFGGAAGGLVGPFLGPPGPVQG